MVEYCRDRNTNSAKSMARSVRSFLRFAHATGRTSAGLRGAVPSSSGWQHLASLPRSVPAADLERLLAVAARSGSRPRTGATTRSCCWPGSGCGEARSQAFAGRHRLAGRRTHRHRQGQPGRAAAPADRAGRSDRRVADRRAARVRDAAVFTTLRPPGRPLVAWGDRPCRGQCTPDCRACPDRRAPPASHAGHGHAAGPGRRSRRWGRSATSAMLDGVYMNSRELHQTGEKPQVAMSGRHSSGLSGVLGMAA